MDINTEKVKEAARLAKNAYAREWRKKNPEKARAATERYWMRVAEKRLTEAAEREGI